MKIARNLVELKDGRGKESRTQQGAILRGTSRAYMYRRGVVNFVYSIQTQSQFFEIKCVS